MNAEVTSLHLAPLDGADGQVMLVQAIVVHINIKLKSSRAVVKNTANTGMVYCASHPIPIPLLNFSKRILFMLHTLFAHFLTDMK